MSTVKIMDIQILLDVYKGMREKYRYACNEVNEHAMIADQCRDRNEPQGAIAHDGFKAYFEGQYLGISSGMYAIRDILKEAGLHAEVARIDMGND